jgi:plasmid stability protein
MVALRQQNRTCCTAQPISFILGEIWMRGVSMATLHVRNVPEELYARIRLQAQSKNRSLSAEVIMLLDKALDGRETQAALLDRIRRRRFFRPTAAGAPDTITLLRQDRRR